MRKPAIVTPEEYIGITKIRPQYAKKLIEHIDKHDDSSYEVIQLNGQYYDVTGAKTEDVINFIKDNRHEQT